MQIYKPKAITKEQHQAWCSKTNKKVNLEGALVAWPVLLQIELTECTRKVTPIHQQLS